MINKIKSVLKNPGFWFGLIVFLVLIFIFSQPPSIKVVQTSPKNQDKEVLVAERILITFNKIPSESEKKDIKIESNPSQTFKSNWKNNSIELSTTPSLKESQEYKINILFKSKNIYSFSFTTAAIQYSQIIKDVQQQSVSDYQFSQAEKKFYDQYPWYRNLPIETSDYRIIYDLQYKQFRIRILKQNVPADEQKNIINNAVSALKKIGVPEPISYYVMQANE